MTQAKIIGRCKTSVLKFLLYVTFQAQIKTSAELGETLCGRIKNENKTQSDTKQSCSSISTL